MNRRLAVATIAVGVDLAFAELPNRYHPVAWLGQGIAFADHCLPQATDQEKWRSGLALATAFVGAAALAACTARRFLGHLPAPLALVVEGVLLKQAFAVRALFEHAGTVERPLRDGDVEGARLAASRMVSRKTDDLPPELLASAAIESLAENSSDSIVAPLLWYAALGLPGAFAYRAANTLDATVGYHSRGRFGTPSARLDDALNVVPARVTAGLIAAAQPRWLAAGGAFRRDARSTPSPNAGWPMAAAAHALGVRLEKLDHHVLNSAARAPGAGDIARARRLLTRSLTIGAGVTAALATARWLR
ncbi:MAG: adenosylcobinamide-phosphate synthase CbiB [Dehalococcoidia bacterium]|nr:adenosylcobinamide-phosphate synthase CbiB [Dehalococcoidia bacterium]